MVFCWNCLAGGQNGIHDLQEVLVDHILVSKNEGHILKIDETRLPMVTRCTHDNCGKKDSNQLTSDLTDLNP